MSPTPAIVLPGTGGDPTGSSQTDTSADADTSMDAASLMEASSTQALKATSDQPAAPDVLRRVAEVLSIGLDTARRLFEIAPGEEDAVIVNAIAALGRALGAVSIALWEVEAHPRPTASPSAIRTHMWTDPDGQTPELPLQFMAAQLPERNISEVDGPVVVSADTDPGGLRSRLGVGHDDLNRLLVPGRLRNRAAVFVVASRPPGQVWHPTEATALEKIAGLLPAAFERLHLEEQIVGAFHGAPVAILIQHQSGDIIDCNDALVRMLGASSEMEYLGAQLGEFVAYDELTDHRFFDVQTSEDLDGLTVPIRTADDKLLWCELSVAPVDGSGNTWMVHLVDVTQRRARELDLLEQARRDAVTGLANRREILEVLAEKASVTTIGADPMIEAPCAVVVIDLNGFKLINDNFGHQAGDQLLEAVARRLSANIRECDTVGRVGGDEFAVVLSGPINELSAAIKADGLAECFATPFEIDAGWVTVGASAGSAVVVGGESISESIARADHRMYENKRSAGDETQPESPGLTSEPSQRA